MNIFIKNLRFKSIACVVSILYFFVFLSSSINASAPEVLNPVANKTAHHGDPFEMMITTYETFSDLDGDKLEVTVKQADGSDLPSWLNIEQKPIDPNLVGVLDTNKAYGIRVVDDRAYIADGVAGFKVINITDPTNPKLIGSVDTNEAYDMTIVDNYAYLSDLGAGFKVINITDQTNPVIIGSLGTNRAYHSVVDENLAYLSDHTAGIKVINITDPTSPNSIGSLDTNKAFGIAKKGEHIYIADGEEGLKVIDITDPTSPSLTGSLDTTGIAYEVAVDDNYAYVTDDTAGLKIINITDPINPNLVGSLDTNNAHGIDLQGHYAYLADYDSGFKVINITDPANPKLVNSLSSYIAEFVRVRGDYAYIADNNEGLKIIENVGEGLRLSGTPSASDFGTLNLKATVTDGENEISTPFSINFQNEAPVVTSSIPDQVAHHGTTFDMTIATYETFSDADGDELNVIVKQDDDSDLPDWLTVEEKTFFPTIVGSLGMTDRAWNVCKVGNYAYVANNADGLRIIDVTDPTNPILIGTFNTSGEARGVTVVGNYAYVADSANGLKIIDVSNPESPSLTGSIDTNYAYLASVIGDYAYVADGVEGLKVIDISNKSSPSLVGSFNTVGIAYSITARGNYVYIADGNDGLKIIDVSTPSAPFLVGSINTTGTVYDVAVSGNYAYLADYFDGLKVIDISSLYNPTLVGTLDTSGAAEGVLVIDEYVYVADSDCGLKIVDVTNPESPTLAGSVVSNDDAEQLDVVGDYAYIADGTAGLTIIGNVGKGLRLRGTPTTSDFGILNLKATANDGVSEISTFFSIDVQNEVPTVINPIVNQTASNGNPFNMTVKTYETFNDADRDKLDITFKQADNSDLPSWLTVGSKPLSPTLVGSLGTTFGSGIMVRENYAYLADSTAGLKIINVTDPSNPNVVGSLGTDRAKGIKVSDNYAYVADGTSGLKVINITDRANPNPVGSLDTSGDARELMIVDNYAYLADEGGGLKVINITDPTDPNLIGSLDTAGSAKEIFVRGKYAYVADFTDGFKIIDISNPLTPFLVGSLPTAGDAYEAVVFGKYAYVAVWDKGLEIIDVSDPYNPVSVGLIDTNTTGAAVGIDVQGNYAYVADDIEGLKIIDIRNASNPILVDSIPTADATHLRVRGDYAYIADGAGGFKIIGGIGEGLFLNGTPSAVDYGMLNLKAIASDGVNKTFTPFSIDVQDDPPVVSDISKFGSEDTRVTFASNDFANKFSDINGESLVQVKIGTLSPNGILKLSEVDVNAGQEISVANLNNLTFDPNNHWYGNTSFIWNGFDGGRYAFSAANVNIEITPTQDAPTITDIFKSGPEDTRITFAAADFTSNFNDLDGENLTKIQVDTLPTNGVLKLSEVNVTLAEEILSGNLETLTFDPTTHWYGNTSFIWKGHDGNEYSNTANVNIEITPTQDAPTITDIFKSGPEDTRITFAAADFTSNFNDLDSESLTKIQVDTLPTNGVLKLSEVDVTATQEIDVGDLGDLTFDPTTHWQGNTSFTWKGHDGTEYSNSSNVNVEITAINDSPIITTETDALIYDDCDGSVIIDDAITITDVDSNYLQEGVVSMQGGVNLVVDYLRFTDQNGILGTYNSDIGELTLIGNATVNDYQTALRSVKFQHIGSFVPSDNIMTSFIVNDGTVYSEVAHRNISISEDISSCIKKTSSFPGWGGGVIVGACAVTTFTIVGITAAILYYNKHKKGLTDSNNAATPEQEDIPLEPIKK